MWRIVFRNYIPFVDCQVSNLLGNEFIWLWKFRNSFLLDYYLTLLFLNDKFRKANPPDFSLSFGYSSEETHQRTDQRSLFIQLSYKNKLIMSWFLSYESSERQKRKNAHIPRNRLLRKSCQERIENGIRIGIRPFGRQK